MSTDTPNPTAFVGDGPPGPDLFLEPDVPSPLVWGLMIDLIYTSHGAKALDYLDKVWDGPDEGKSAFRADFRDALVRSAYWPAIADLNGWDIDDPF